MLDPRRWFAEAQFSVTWTKGQNKCYIFQNIHVAQFAAGHSSWAYHHPAGSSVITGHLESINDHLRQPSVQTELQNTEGNFLLHKMFGRAGLMVMKQRASLRNSHVKMASWNIRTDSVGQWSVTCSAFPERSLRFATALDGDIHAYFGLIIRDKAAAFLHFSLQMNSLKSNETSTRMFLTPVVHHAGVFTRWAWLWACPDHDWLRVPPVFAPVTCGQLHSSL